ncbi:tRNA (adenosine(37)-N6)-threonylcarbamoyltransferase complex dimerization subunit type 1 TsaB [Cellvibrio japonicus]|nr:tRNA (adenosine(37)-N6)-threonylcarbamoyltransferase complex dimerization subunit type 1 TsaB [Cellvibrio japonicus]QEI12543.1 tRNA (adenosine(37)-N6)-threonylcarbamoyltransferase complex dimerization subunit type 1 TsaB [Cellvibrio japonicus]QEI16117.1 tRNA (adenosine(37)-N6)-threonylcarbamoyltransferase complex dimerization subunit type 1 TsaB [Cellvibrio japonicus]QEI19695.1 tRNA (adenosine(37)-N6)-threonylcarbamoyltransferase complex dimerization subunit type 1 TsaB [Cellvibrio japonicus]
MSLILALDSSTDACSVALNRDGKLGIRHEIATKSHTQRLLPMVDEVLGEEGISVSEVDVIAFGRGPGSFTGLRICMGIVQGLAYGSGIPVVPVSTLEAMALQVYRQHPEWRGPVMVALDARMDEVYWGLFEYAGNDSLANPSGEHVMKPVDVMAHASLVNLPPFIAAGPGWHYPLMQALASRQATACLLDIQPRAEEIALLAVSVVEAGRTQDIHAVQPVYLRDSVSWQKRQRIREQALVLDRD